ncbi:MAG: radical SAM protein [Candidatus Methanoperedens sp.]
MTPRVTEVALTMPFPSSSRAGYKDKNNISIYMENLNYILNDDLIVRKEFFGSLVFNHSSKHYHQYNEDATLILNKFVKASNLKTVIEELKFDYELDSNDIEIFVEQCYDDNILVKANNGKLKSDCFTFFFDTTVQRTDCFYSPTTMSVYITFKCTKKCKHCVNSASPDRDTTTELTQNQWFKILDQMRNFGIIYIVFTGGELFTRKDWFEIVSYADKLKFSYALLTDFDYLDSAILEKIKKFKYIDHIMISLDGATSDTHDFIRGAGAFQRSLKKLGLLKNSGLKFNISTTVTKLNKHELKDISNLAIEYGANAIWFNPLAPFGRGENLVNLVLSDDELMELSKTYLDIISESQIKPGNEFWSMIADDSDNLAKFNPLKGNPYSISLAIYNFSIDAYGDCYLDSKMRAKGILPLGNIFDSDIKTLWNTEKLSDLRNQYKFGEFTFKDIREIEAQILNNY